MKKFLLIAAIVAGLAASVVVVVLYFTADLVVTADAFFKAVAARDMATAGSYLARDFRLAESNGELADHLQRLGLADYAESHWPKRHVDANGTGKLSGTIITNSHGTIPLSIFFVKENGAWKIYSFRKSDAGFGDDSSSPTIPSPKDAAILATTTTMAFAHAVKAKDLKSFYATTSPDFQKSVSYESFAGHFSGFVTKQADLTSLAAVEPQLTARPEMTSQNVLHIEGFFPFNDSEVSFHYKYVYRFIDWKILGFEFRVGPTHSSVDALRAAAEKDDAIAENNLANLLFRGAIAARSENESITWYRKAADHGLADAQNNLGYIFMNGSGVPKDETQAAALFRKAAAQGYAQAEFNLAYVLSHGVGVDKDDVEAAAWYRKAAEQGDADAQFHLAVALQKGIGVKKNESEAATWFEKAAAQGNADAKKHLLEPANHPQTK